MTELKIFKAEEPERFEGVLKCKKNYRAENGDEAFTEGKCYPWRWADRSESDYTGCEIVLIGEHGECHLDMIEMREHFEGVYASPVTGEGITLGGQIIFSEGDDTISISPLFFIGEDHYTTAIKELTDAILSILGEEETPHDGYQDYMLIGDEVNAAIRLAKKYKQLIEGKS